MKPRSIILVAIIAGVFSNISSQELLHADLIRKQFKCFVTAETISGEKMEAALYGFAPDSIFLAPLEDKYIRAGGRYIKILKEETYVSIGVDSIKKFKIKYDPNIIYGDELTNRKKQLKRKNVGRIIGITVGAMATIVLIPIATYTGSDFDPFLLPIPNSGNTPRNVSLAGNDISITKRGRSFNIDGENEKYIKMVKMLTKSDINLFKKVSRKN